MSNLAIQLNPLVTRTYSSNGHLASLAIARSNTVADTTTFSYDGLDRLSTTAWPDSSTEVLSYDSDSNVTKRVTRKGDSISFAYDTLNRLCTKTYAISAVLCGGTSANYLVTFAYDLAGRLLAANDNGASIQAVTASASYAENLLYDSRNELINANWTPAPNPTPPTATSVKFHHQYDATNRRIGQMATDNSWLNYPSTPATTNYTANNLNQYTAVGSASPTYDANGNLTNDGTDSYCYDTESHLTSILSAGTCASPTTIVASYAYDAQGRRKSKTVGSATTLFVTDADNREVLEYDGTSGAVNAWYAYATGPNDVLNRVNVAGGSRATLIPDIQGSIIGSLDSGGSLTKTGYQPFGGNPSLSSGSFQYAAARFDPESGLYYLRNRMYRTDWGRFPQPDTIGYAGGNNLYAYVNNDPLNFVDPSGLAPGDPYSSTNAAAIQAIRDINPTSITQDVEYAGRIYQTFGGTISYTAPVPGNSVTSSPYAAPTPFLSTTLGTYHTHGNDWAVVPGMPTKLPYDFSPNDITGYKEEGLNGYVGTPNGSILEYNVGTGQDTVIGTGALPSSPVPPAQPPTFQQLQQLYGGVDPNRTNSDTSLGGGTNSGYSNAGK